VPRQFPSKCLYPAEEGQHFSGRTVGPHLKGRRGPQPEGGHPADLLGMVLFLHIFQVGVKVRGTKPKKGEGPLLKGEVMQG